MRTDAEIRTQIEECKAYRDYSSREDRDYDDGLQAGFYRGLLMIEQGKTSAEIAAFAKDDEDDAYQTGFIEALGWVDEAFDWNENGEPIFRDGGETPLFGEGEVE